MDWVRHYGQGRVYTTMLGHTWKDGANPNLDDVSFQALLARGAEWAATGDVTLPAGSRAGSRCSTVSPSTAGKSRGDCHWSVLPDGTLLGQRTRGTRPDEEYDAWLGSQAWLYTKAEYGEFDLHLEYWIPPGGNSGVSIRDRSRAHGAIGETDTVRPDLAAFPKDHARPHRLRDPDHRRRRREVPHRQRLYLCARPKPASTATASGTAWRSNPATTGIRVRLNGEVVAEGPGEARRAPRPAPIGLQLHDQFTMAMFRNLRLRAIEPRP